MFFATAGEKGRVKLWRSDTGTCVYEEPSGAGLVPGSAAAEYTDLSLLPGGAGLLAITADARLLFLAPGAAAEKAKGAAKGAGKRAPGKGLVLSRQLVGNMDEVTDVRFVGSKSNPSHIAIATNSEAVRLFDLRGLSCVASLVGHRDTVLCLDAALAPPAPPLASSSSDAAAGAGAAGAAAAGVVVTLLASGAKDQEVRVWAAVAAAGAPAAASASAPDEPADGAPTSSSTSAPAAAAAVEVRCLGVGTGHVGAVSAVALSRRVAAGKTPFLVSAGADRLLKVWELAGCVAAAGRLRVPSAGVDGGVDGSVDEAKPEALRASAAVLAHDKDVNSVAVAPNDSLVATGSQDKTAKVWRMPNLTPVATLRGHRRGVWSVEFSPVDQVWKVWEGVEGRGQGGGRVWALPDRTDLMAYSLWPASPQSPLLPQNAFGHPSNP